MSPMTQLVLLRGRVYQPNASALSQVCWYEFSLKKLLTVPLTSVRTWSVVHGLLLGLSWKLTSRTTVLCSPKVLVRPEAGAPVVVVVPPRARTSRLSAPGSTATAPAAPRPCPA